MQGKGKAKTLLLHLNQSKAGHKSKRGFSIWLFIYANNGKETGEINRRGIWILPASNEWVILDKSLWNKSKSLGFWKLQDVSYLTFPYFNLTGTLKFLIYSSTKNTATQESFYLVNDFTWLFFRLYGLH